MGGDEELDDIRDLESKRSKVDLTSSFSQLGADDLDAEF